ncbi:hypothetical protein B0H19DRAFT_187613 [Mycena capillaripes]|nr:hypothetical protein B0H19DRAFT_187613 [Mycena capillaripes]
MGTVALTLPSASGPLDECSPTFFHLSAMATTTMPPTTHALPHAQRLRLMRSTRKLGALLGETPLVETTTTAPSSFAPSLSRSPSTMSTDSKRSGRVYMSESIPRTSALKLKLTKPPPTADAAFHAHGHGHAHADRPTLVLRLPPPTHAGPAHSPVERTPLVSPLSPTFGFGLALNSPATPTFPAESSRVRKMAKLARTLGENVPPELVFRDAAAATNSRRRRASVLSVRHPAGAEEPFAGPSTVPYVAAARASTDTHTSAETYASHELLLAHPRTGMHRSEQGWSGEWGGAVADMQDVVRNLRSLKMK